jgi:catechol 2,3-dioxygenase-like lactoylglutathione lyase family enzyme
MKIEIQALDHLVLRAKNAAELIRFYCDILNCKIERALPELGLTQLRAGNSLIDIVAVDSELGRRGGGPATKQNNNLDHFCLTIAAVDAQQLLTYLDEQGVAHGDFENRYGAQGFGDSIYIEDPEGNVVELKPSR